jgi:hypothetical protein
MYRARGHTKNDIFEARILYAKVEENALGKLHIRMITTKNAFHADTLFDSFMRSYVEEAVISIYLLYHLYRRHPFSSLPQLGREIEPAAMMSSPNLTAGVDYDDYNLPEDIPAEDDDESDED